MMMNRNGIAIALGAGLAFFIAGVYRSERRDTRGTATGKRHKVAPAQLHTWEGEGGNVPDVPTPGPVAAPTLSTTKPLH